MEVEEIKSRYADSKTLAERGNQLDMKTKHVLHLLSEIDNRDMEIKRLTEHSEAIRKDYLAMASESLERSMALTMLEAEIITLKQAMQNWHESEEL